MPQRFRQYGAAALVLAALFVVLTAVDDRVPRLVTDGISQAAAGQWTAPGTPLGNVMLSIDSSPVANNAFVAALLAAGVVLVFLMVRT